MSKSAESTVVNCMFDMRASDFDYMEAAVSKAQLKSRTVTELMRKGFSLIYRGGNLLMPSLNTEAHDAAINTKLSYGEDVGRFGERVTLSIKMLPSLYIELCSTNGTLGYDFEEQTIVYGGMVIAKSIHEEI